MDQQVFDIEAVRKLCLDLLRMAARTLTTGQICIELGLPYWAVNAGMNRALTSGQAKFTAGAGWSLAVRAERQREEDATQGGLL